MSTHSTPARKPLPFAFGIALSLAGASLGGCFEATDGSSGMNAVDYDEVAAALGTLVADESRGQPSAFAGAALLARGVVPSDFEVAGDVAFGERLGLEYSLSAVCSDAAGRGALCGEDAAMAHVAVSWSGDWRSDRVAASSDFDGDWTLTGLDQDRVVLDGRAQASALVALVPESDLDARGWRLDYRASYDAVGIDAKTRRAVSGQVFYDLVIERRAAQGADGSHFVTVDARLCFQPDGSALLTLDADQVYKVNRDGSVERTDRGTAVEGDTTLGPVAGGQA